MRAQLGTLRPRLGGERLTPHGCVIKDAAENRHGIAVGESANALPLKAAKTLNGRHFGR